MAPIRWVCPHCEHASVITHEANIKRGAVECRLDSADGALLTGVEYVVCPNPACRKVTLTLWHGSGFLQSGVIWQWTEKHPRSRRLLPPSYARPIPDYVPQAIRDDYEEACAIADLSPKAAAALARRALQGIVRDFHGIRKSTLNQELEALKALIDPTVWKAIDAVRSVGNIGAHMEKDINVIVDVEPQEAVRLLRLIEMLVQEWYVARQKREEELAAIIAIGDAKKAQLAGAPQTQLPTDTVNTDGEGAA